MRVATLQPQDHALEAINAVCERVQFAVARGHLGVLGLGLCVRLLHLRRNLDKFWREVSAAEVSTAGDRDVLRQVGRFCQQVADRMGGDRDRLASMQRPPFFLFMLLRLFDPIVIKAEDMAETAALSASVEFAGLVKEDLRAHSEDSAVRTDG